jgi:hypothetical protein
VNGWEKSINEAALGWLILMGGCSPSHSSHSLIAVYTYVSLHMKGWGGGGGGWNKSTIENKYRNCSFLSFKLLKTTGDILKPLKILRF